jgi:hypothetical protein
LSALLVAALSGAGIEDTTSSGIGEPSVRTASPAIADTDIREYAAVAGRKVAGRPVGGPYPTADDLAFVVANRLPLFVIGEWARPAPMWEVAWVDGAVRYRTIGDIGEIGPWQD